MHKDGKARKSGGTGQQNNMRLRNDETISFRTQSTSHQQSHSASVHSIFQIDDPDDLILDFNVSSIDPFLKKCVSLSRLFVRRHPLQSKRFDILDEDGRQIFQLQDYSKGSETTPLNYILKDGAGEKQLMTFIGDPGFLGLNGEIVARYPNSQPGYKELSIGRVKQTTNCCSLTPKCVIYDHNDKPRYNIVDKNKSSVLWPGRVRAAPNYDIHQNGPTVEGHIDERRLIVNHATRAKGNYRSGRRSIATGSPVYSHNSTPGKSSKESNSSVKANTEDGQRIGRLSNFSLASTGSGLMMRYNSVEEVTEKPTHDHFCIAFKPLMDYKMKIMMLCAHLIVNDDLVRRRKKCTRGCCVLTICVFLFLCVILVVGVGALIYFKVLKFGVRKR